MTDLHTIEIAGTPNCKTFPIVNETRVVFGRSSNCVGTIPEDNRMSRRHFRVEAQFPELKLRDLGSLHGTIVQRTAQSEEQPYGGKHRKGKKKAMAVAYLTSGAIVRAGQTVFEVQLSPHCFICCHSIPSEDAQSSEIRPGIYICSECLSHKDKKAWEERIQKWKRCLLCGENTGHEIPNAGAGAYICRACRRRAYQDVDILSSLLHKTEEIREDRPNTITDYELLKLLGVGSMGASFIGRRKDNSRVAIKIFLPKIAARSVIKQYFLEKLEQYQNIKHPHLVSCYDFGYAASGFYLVQEYCRGESISRSLAHTGGMITYKQAVPIIFQALEGLDFLHSKGIYHRNLKPQNLLLTENTTVKLTDWAICSEYEKLGLSSHTMTGMISDIPGYVPREQLTHFADMNAASDIWSMAAILYLMLTAHLPRHFSDDQHQLDVVLEEEVVHIKKRNPKVPGTLADVIHRALSEDPRKRYQTAMEFRKALENAI